MPQIIANSVETISEDFAGHDEDSVYIDSVYIAGAATRRPWPRFRGNAVAIGSDRTGIAGAGPRRAELNRRFGRFKLYSSSTTCAQQREELTGMQAVAWCVSMIRQLIESVGPRSLGRLGVSYRSSLASFVLPSVSVRAAELAGVKPDLLFDECVQFGSSGPLYSIENAIEYCRASQKAAIICTFDRCEQSVDVNRAAARGMSMEAHSSHVLNFDGAAAIILIPHSMKSSFEGPKLRVVDIASATDFRIDQDSSRGCHSIAGATKSEFADAAPTLGMAAINRFDIDDAAISVWSKPHERRFISSGTSLAESASLDPSAPCSALEGIAYPPERDYPNAVFALSSMFDHFATRREWRKELVVCRGANNHDGAMLCQWIDT